MFAIFSIFATTFVSAFAVVVIGPAKDVENVFEHLTFNSNYDGQGNVVSVSSGYPIITNDIIAVEAHMTQNTLEFVLLETNPLSGLYAGTFDSVMQAMRHATAPIIDNDNFPVVTCTHPDYQGTTGRAWESIVIRSVNPHQMEELYAITESMLEIRSER